MKLKNQIFKILEKKFIKRSEIKFKKKSTTTEITSLMSYSIFDASTCEVMDEWSRLSSSEQPFPGC